MPSAASGRGGGTSTLFAWGCVEDGQLGAAEAPTPGATETNDWCVEAPRAVELGESASGVIVSACAGSRNSVCVTTREYSSSCEAYAWGWNSHRALGFSYEECDELHVKTPKRHSSMKTEDGERINVVAIVSGGWHAVCVDSDGVAYGYGGNEYAQAGPPDANAEHRNTSIPDRDWAPIRALLWPPRKVSLPAPVAQVSCGGMSSFALLHDGRVFEWGQTSEDDEPRTAPRQLDAKDKHVVEIAAGSFHLLMRTRNGEVMSYGNGSYGQLGLGATGAADVCRVIETFGRLGVVKIAAGGWHSAAVTAGGVLYTWGRGEYGLLGHGDDVKDKVVPKLVELDESVFIADIALGGSHSCAITAEGNVLSWGRTTLGRLGRVILYPSSSTCGVPSRVAFPPLPNGKRWKALKISCGGRHTLAVCTVSTDDADVPTA